MKVILKQKISKFCYSKKAYFMLSPIIAYLLIFSIGPMLYALGMSFLKWNLISKPTFVGLTNYTNIFTNDPKFRTSFLNNLFYTAMLMGVGIPLALIVAMFLNGITFSSLRSLYIAIYFLPVITSMVVVALVWKYLYDPGAGFINHVLWTLRLSPQRWLTSSKQAMLSITITAIWKNLGFSTVLFLAALQGIPSMFYEAAKIDGASRWDRFSHITLPLLAPVTIFVLIITAIDCFQVFTLVFMMTMKGGQSGGPGTSTLVMGLYTYQNAFLYNKGGYSAALAYTIFFIVLFFTFLQLQAYKRKMWEY